ncbi:MAG: hypothetical protein KKC75_02745 [Nanoarchaeota archaeon]|nr:hypothetical protein [Nanoarchaeota archaeon]MBU1005502.1 hypothetical protein [Nanoarchaeota archaeon]MBU1945716.1 hypothetical protein [Nanoarchaeota archaeon]
MDILDRQFIALPKRKKAFIITIGTGFLLVGLIAYRFKLTNLVESSLIIIIGILYAELIKMHYRLKKLEKKK